MIVVHEQMICFGYEFKCNALVGCYFFELVIYIFDKFDDIIHLECEFFSFHFKLTEIKKLIDKFQQSVCVLIYKSEFLF